MTPISFTKMHGLGNSYIYIDQHRHTHSLQDPSALAITVSRHCTGIGSDGLILIEPSSVATVKMRIFNKDGSEGKNCGNGLRCVAKYAYEHGLTNSTEITIETLSGIFTASIIEHNATQATVSINMGHPKLLRGDIPMLGDIDSNVIAEPFQIDETSLALTCVSMGNPHAVFFIPSILLSPHHILGPKIETDPRFPEGVNVEFIEVESANSLHFRVWERGSGATKACGTGACAAVVAAVLNGHCRKDDDVTMHLEGGDLRIRWESSGNVIMTGAAATIASGFFMLH